MGHAHEVFVTIGAVLGIVATIMIIILQFHRVCLLVTSFFKWLYLCPRRIQMMLEQWRRTRKLGPSWEVTEIGIAEVTHSDDSYHITVPIEVKYTNRDPRFSIQMDCGTILMDMYNLGKGRDKDPYRLYSTTELVTFRLLKMGTINKCYLFSSTEEGMPLLGEYTSCKIIAIGKARIHGINNPVSLHPKKIKVAVHKSPGVI